MTPDPAPLVRLADARALGYCASGCRAWCARHGLDWAALRGPGLPLAAVAAVGDAMAERVVAAARARAAAGAGDGQ